MIEATSFSIQHIDEALNELLENEDSAVHGYTPASGLPTLRAALADALQQFEFPLAPEQIYVTCGSDAFMVASKPPTSRPRPAKPSIMPRTSACGVPNSRVRTLR